MCMLMIGSDCERLLFTIITCDENNTLIMQIFGSEWLE